MVLTAVTVSAMELGFGFNREMPVVRIGWDENLRSEAGISFYSESGPDSLREAKLRLSLTPAMYRVYEWEFIKLYASLRLCADINYSDTASNPSFLRMHNYSVNIVFPDFELAVPYVKGLYATASAGLYLDWSFDARGASEGVKTGIFVPSVYSIGLVYYLPQETPVPSGEVEK